MNSDSDSGKRITADKQFDDDGNPKAFLLRFRGEQIVLEPGKPWARVDTCKWVTRGLIEEPRGFHVHADGSVEIHGEQIELRDPKAIARLETAVNKRFEAPVPKPARPATAAHLPSEQSPPSNKVRFKVRLDHMGHLMVECEHAGERIETGIRGLPGLVRNGLMLKPKDVHVHPLLTYVEIDGARFESTPAGVEALQNRLNEFYAPILKDEGHSAVEIRDNPAAATGFDIHFVTFRAGARFEVKGHLCQQHLDVLQDPVKCELLRPGTILRLSAPFLIIRRRRPDGSEDKIPELPDLQYRRATASELQQILNHPAIRPTGSAHTQTLEPSDQEPDDLIAFRLARNPQSKVLLWLECVTSQGVQGKAFTHHNIADLQHAGVFRANFDVNLSLDNRTLSFLDSDTHEDERITIDYHSPDAELERAAQMLTAALKPPSPRATKPAPAAPPTAAPPAPTDATNTQTAPPAPPADAVESATVAAVDTPPEPASAPLHERPPHPIPLPLEGGEGARRAGEGAVQGFKARTPSRDSLPQAPSETRHPVPTPSASIAPPVSSTAQLPVSDAKHLAESTGDSSPGPTDTRPAAPPVVNSPVSALFCETDPVRINIEIFRRLEAHLGVQTQHLRLSLERVFQNRQFEVLSLSHPEITSVMEIRSEHFVGFYLSYVNERKVLLDYACQGKRIEWGPEKSLLQLGVAADPDEFNGSPLRGMALIAGHQFVFVVSPAFKLWLKHREKLYLEASASFATIDDIAADPDRYPIIWPQP